MKIEYYKDRIIARAINKKLSNDINEIKELLYDVFNNFLENYDIDIRNNYDIKIYINELYGVIVEMIILKKNVGDCENNIRLNMYFNKLFLYEVEDPLEFINNEIYYYKEKYYLNINELDIRLLEQSNIIYDDFVYKVLGRGIKI